MLAIVITLPELSSPLTPERLNVAPPVEFRVTTILPAAVPENDITSAPSATTKVSA